MYINLNNSGETMAGIAKKKIRKVLKEFKAGKLRSGKPGSGKGKTVTSRKQALAIALSEGRKASGSLHRHNRKKKRG